MFSQEVTFREDWGPVTLSFWRKYPNPWSAHIKEVDVFNRSYNPVTGDLVSFRMFTVGSPLPRWLTMLGIPESCYAVEKTVCNARSRTLAVTTQNLTGLSVLKYDEHCTYSAHPTNPHWTLYKQAATVSAAPAWALFRSQLETYGIRRVTKAAHEGVMVIEKVCQAMATYGLQPMLRGTSFSLLDYPWQKLPTTKLAWSS